MLPHILIDFLYTWELQFSVILSISIQIILVLIGSWRKTSNATWLNIVVWCAYVSADAVAVFSLGLLAQNRVETLKEDTWQKHRLYLLWIPFLILHLGGPDSITAYSLEDNNLWLRHLLNVVIQVGVALYAVLTSWNDHNPFKYLVIPVFVWGFIKYCERISALASLEHIHDRYHQHVWADTKTNTDFDHLYQYLSTLTYYFADEYIPREEPICQQGKSILELKSSAAFKLVEDELGLMYDLLYTKASVIDSRWGICLRCVYLVSSMAILVSFVIIHTHEHLEGNRNYPFRDVLITYFLIIGAVIIEIYAAILILLSDWALIWLDKHQNSNGYVKDMFEKISASRKVLLSEKRWSRSLKQHNILKGGTRYLKRIMDCFFYVSSRLKLFRWKKKRFEFEIISEVDVDDDNLAVKEEVWEVIKEKPHVRDRRAEYMVFSEFISKSGLSDLWDSTRGSDDFGTSLFAWYLFTTDFRFFSGEGDNNMEQVDSGSKHKASSRYLSDYLMYLVRFRQNMLPPGNYKLRYERVVGRLLDMGEKDKRQYFENALKEGHTRKYDDNDCYQVNPIYEMANSLISHFKIRRGSGDPPPRNIIAKNWRKISEVWVYMLVYAAASQNIWAEHAQQLRLGGEFLTHVAVLIAHTSQDRLSNEFVL